MGGKMNYRYHDSEAVDFRSYRHIFTDHNQTNPEDEIKLGFESNYKHIVLPAGETTTFHFPLRPVGYEGKEPQAIDGMPIRDSNLILDGAVCGHAPYCADRVYAKNAGYEWKDVWGNYHPEAMQDGEWLCAWLSGDTTNPDAAMWVDRWYDPKLTREEAEAAISAYGKIIDVPSELKFRYGSQYKYDRIGNADIRAFVDEVDASGLLVHIDDWALSGCRNTCQATSGEISVRNNECEEDMFFKTQVNAAHEGDYGVRFNGDSTVQIDANDLIKHGEKDFTVAAFVKHDDWNNSRGCAIIDRGYHGGWQISCAPKPKNNLICMLGTDKDGNTTLAVYSTDFELLSKRTLTSLSNVHKTFIDDEFYIWGLQTDKIVKTDLNGNFVYSMNHGMSAGPNTIFQMLGGSEYGYGRVGNKKFDMVSMTLSSGTPSGGGLNMVVGRTEWLEIYEGQAEKHNANDWWQGHVGIPLISVDSGETVRRTVIDSDNNIFVLTEKHFP